MVAFVAPVAGRRQIWIRMLSGGAPLRVTHDDGDHEFPRWTADGSAIVYYAQAGPPWRIGHALGSVRARRTAAAARRRRLAERIAATTAAASRCSIRATIAPS